MEASDNRYGLALSGGAARGIAHLGVLKAMNEQGISPEIISGTSAGAMVACFYADGFDPEEVLEIIENESLFKKINLTFPRKGIFNPNKIFDMFSKNLKTKNIEDFDRPVYIGVTDFLEGKLKYLTKGPVIQALKATSAVPGLFNPVEINGSFYYDGGLISNLPVEPLEGKCDQIIGCNVNPVEQIDRIGPYTELMIRTLLIGVSANVHPNIPKCSIYIEPEMLYRYPLTDNSHYREIFDIGYKKATDIFS